MVRILSPLPCVVFPAEIPESSAVRVTNPFTFLRERKWRQVSLLEMYEQV